MTNSTRFTLAKTSVLVAGIVGALALTGCSDSHTSGTASGSLDDLKYHASVRSVAAKTHKETKREKQTKRVCSGTGAKRTCKTVDDGYKTVTVTVTDKPGKPGKPAMYCVELDNVNGKADDDDQWFEVSASTYTQWTGKTEGTKVKKMRYDRKLSSCSR